MASWIGCQFENIFVNGYLHRRTFLQEWEGKINQPSKSLPLLRRILGKPSLQGPFPMGYLVQRHFHSLPLRDHKYSHRDIPISAFQPPLIYGLISIIFPITVIGIISAVKQAYTNFATTKVKYLEKGGPEA